MAIKLTIGQAHSCVLGLNAIENAPDVKLKGETRLAIAININLLRPIAEAYDRTRVRVLADLNKDNRGEDGKPKRSDAELQAEMLEQDGVARGRDAGEFDLRTFPKAGLDLDANPKITGAMIAQIMPVLADATTS